MPNLRSTAGPRQVQFALAAAGWTTLTAALGGVALFLAGSLLLSLDLGLGHSARLSLPNDLLARGPLGWATWMALVGTCGAPCLGLGVFTVLCCGRWHAD